MEEWKEYKLGDIVDLVIDYRGKTPLKLGGSWSDSGYRALSAKNIKTGQIVNEESIRYVDDELYHKWMKDEVQRGDILITSEAPFGQVFFWDSDEKIILSQRLFCLRLSEKVHPRFVYYYMTTYAFQHELDGRSTGTTVVGLRQPELLKCHINLPCFKNQVTIATILKSLDDKIEVNRRINDNFVIEKFFEILLIWMLTIPINDNLEQQAQALFKSWFVDFEPFKDDEFVESELGMIPKGWRVGTIDDICCFESGFAFKSATYKQEGEYKLITIKNVQDGYLDVNGLVSINEVPEKLPQYCFLNIGDILLSLTGNVGRCCFVDEENLLLNQRVAKLKPRVGSNWGYIYTLFRNCAFKERVISIARGTAQANLSPVETSKLKIIVPSENTLEKFSQIINGYYHIMIINMIESRRLASLRDTLLPKLMSGELKVFDKPNDQS